MSQTKVGTATYAELTDDAELVLVDSAEAQQRNPRLFATALARKQAPRRPIVPAYVRNKDERNQLLRWLAAHFGHIGAYHLTRIPKYAGKIALRAPVGAFRFLAVLSNWVFDQEARPARSDAIARKDSAEYIALSKQRNERVKLRLAITGAMAAAAVAGLTAVVLLCGPVIRLSLVLLAVVALGAIGRPKDKPLLDCAVVVPRVQRLTSDVVIRALSSLGIAGITQALTKNSDAIAFTAPITRDGPGWRADIDLPYGVTVGEVADRRDKLAAGLTRPLGCVWPEGNAEIHPGRLVLWVGDEDMAKSKQAAWPLLKTGTVDLFGQFPFGTDPRGRVVPLELMYSNLLVGSLPGAGKTFSLRVPLLAAALDPRAEMWTYELKGSGDLEALAAVSARYASGADDEEIEQALNALRQLRRECSRRAATIKNLPKDVCPENKVTSELASKKSLGLHPLVVAIDECQELFSHPTYGAEAGVLAEKIIKLGRALGVVLLLATQRPDSKSLPTGVSANVGTRFCLRVMGQIENDLILGTSMYRNGVRATMFTRRDRGMGYLVGADDPKIVRTFYIDGQAAEAVIARARAARQAAGTLTGYAAGDTEAHTVDLLDDVLRVVSERMWSETVCAALAELRPDAYTGWGPEQLAAALKPHGIATKQLYIDGANRRGIERSAIRAAIEERDAARSLDARLSASTDLAPSGQGLET